MKKRRAGATATIGISVSPATNDVVLTGDYRDLRRLQAFFPGVRVLAL